MTERRWTEAEVSALGPDEYDFQEFKGSAWMCDGRDLVAGFLVALSKQVSAFCNGSGGRVCIGLDDMGLIDGGVPVDLKQGGTRSWLEDVVPGLVDPPLSSFNIHEVQAELPGSPIAPGHAVYVIEIPPSENAPHQALDHRYYLRIAGKSRPMGHVHIQDVLSRTRHPRVRVGRVAPFGPVERFTDDPRGPKVLVTLRVFLENHGRQLAHHVGGELVVPRPLVNREVRRRMLSKGGVTLTQKPGHLHFFRYHPHPVFPGQDVFFLKVSVAIHRRNLDLVASGSGALAWRVYADSAPVVQGRQALAEFAMVREGLTWLRAQLA